ncbi:Spy/CpxP family protein refolding chaperone [Klebsiella quasipneumoniae]|uniref:Spy/CpxP family protein refolding chaperone n=1 Tax=Klebsiella quasipneumoniae TaxID=1463165 RepID=UPI003529E406
MKLITRIAFATLLTSGFSLTAQAADVQAAPAPAPAQDPIVQHLKLTSDQVAKIKSLHQQLENNVQQISQQDIKDGALINVIDSGKWNEKAVKDQLAAFSKIDQQVRYYRVKYYFDVNQVLTPEQRTQVKKDLADALSE